MAIILILFLLLSPGVGARVSCYQDSNRIKTLKSLTKLDNFPLYVMFFYGDYPLPDYSPGTALSQNIQKEQTPLSTSWACSCFSVKTEKGSQILGRNFDWENHPALLLFTDPPDRYASVSMVDISYLGYSKRDDPKKNPGGLFESPLLPFDGMNEKGLAIGMMAVPAAEPPSNPQNETVGSLLIIRLMLDYAQDVDEAISLVKNFNIVFRGGPPLHYFITDRSGKSAVVELVNQKISVLRSTHAWQVATNFVITGLSFENGQAPCWRYRMAWETLENQAAKFSLSAALSLLKDISQHHTIWSIVYDTSSLNFQVFMGKNYDMVHEFNLRQKPGA